MIKKFTIPRDELRPGDFPIEVSDNYIEVYREIPEFGTSAELTALREELADAKGKLTKATQVAHHYFEQARQLEELGENRLAMQSSLQGNRILAALRGEELQDWPLPKTISVQPGNSASAWNAWLELALDTKLDDGTPILKAVLDLHPELAKRLDKAIGKRKAQVVIEEPPRPYNGPVIPYHMRPERGPRRS